MLFGDEKRFSKSLVSSTTDKQVMGITSPSTESHIGPGSYFDVNSDEKRNGWQSKSFSRRSPMTPSPRDSRADSYVGGVLTSYGALASPISPKQRYSIGPGHYEGDVMLSFARKKSNSGRVEGTISSPRSPPSPRFAFNQSLVLKDGVLFQSAENCNKPIGPGYYSVPVDNTLLRPSFNVRASSRPTTPRAVSPSFLRSSGDSGRPRSASSPRHNLSKWK